MKNQQIWVDKTLDFISKKENYNYEFLKSTAKFLAELFQVDFVFLNKYSLCTPNTTETITFYSQNEFLPNTSYNLKNTPCENVINKKSCVYTRGVQVLFPLDKFLVKNNIQSYIGIPLWDSLNRPIGVLGIMHTSPIKNTKNIELILQIIVLKVERVLEKILQENILKSSIEKDRSSEAKFQDLSNLNFEGILIHNNGIALDMNLSFEIMFGYSREELLGKNIIELLILEKYWKTIETNGRGNITPVYEIEVVKKDGTVLPIEVEARTITKGKNNNNRVVSFRDITKRKKSETENKKLSIVLEQSANIIIITNEKGKVEYTNPKFTEITGYTPEEVLNKNPRMLISGTNPEDYCSKLGHTVVAGKIWKGQIQIKAKKGNNFWVQATITPIKNDNGDIINYLGIIEDITKKKLDKKVLLEANRKIKKSEKKFRELYEKSGDAILIIENEIFVDCNKATVKMLNYKKKESFLNQHPSQLSPQKQPGGKSSREMADEMMSLAIKKGTHRFEWIYKKKNGEEFPVEVLLTTISKEPLNKIIHCVWRDITARKKSEINLNKAFEIIKDKEDYLGKILKTANEGFWIVNKEAITKDVNAEMCNILGYSENEIIGKSIFEFVDDENAKIFYDELENRSKGLATNYEISLLKKNGESTPCLFSPSTMYNKNNERIGSFALVTNISSLKIAYNKLENKNSELVKLSHKLSEKNRLLFDSKDRFRTLFEKSPISLWEEDYSVAKEMLIKKKSEVDDLKTYLDENNEFVEECISKIKIIRVNHNTLNLFKINNKEELLTQLRKTLSNNSMEVLKRELLAIVSNVNEFGTQSEFIRSDGKEIFTILKMAKLDVGGKVIVSLTDITALKKVEKELKISKEKAEESNRLKTEFLNNMSHEIRTPMNGILGFSDLLNNTQLTDAKRKYFINIIQNSGKQLLHVIDDILEISRLGTKQVKVFEKEVCLNDLLFELFSVFDIKAKENKTPLYLKNGLSDKESTILTDTSKLNKILSNLLENALKFTNEGSVSFGYNLKNNFLEIFVKDTGIGIEKEKQEIIFERFSQEGKFFSRNIGGLGLGLSIAKENTELLGGNISVESDKGLGSIFQVSIPYKPVYKVPSLKKGHSMSGGFPEKYIILITEDEEVNYLFMEILIKDGIKLPCSILHAKDGLEAIEIFKNSDKIDLVLMDLSMPVMNGYEATKKLKLLKPELPIIAQTAYSTSEDKSKAIIAGCDDFITKPINKENLLKILNKYLPKKRALIKS